MGNKCVEGGPETTRTLWKYLDILVLFIILIIIVIVIIVVIIIIIIILSGQGWCRILTRKCVMKL